MAELGSRAYGRTACPSTPVAMQASWSRGLLRSPRSLCVHNAVTPLALKPYVRSSRVPGTPSVVRLRSRARAHIVLSTVTASSSSDLPASSTPPASPAHSIPSSHCMEYACAFSGKRTQFSPDLERGGGGGAGGGGAAQSSPEDCTVCFPPEPPHAHLDDVGRRGTEVSQSTRRDARDSEVLRSAPSGIAAVAGPAAKEPRTLN